MANMEWTVRVIVPREPVMPSDRISGMWVEQLCYAYGVRILAENDDRMVVEFPCPYKTRGESGVWARQNSERMRSFGINAVSAPRWNGSDKVDIEGNSWRRSQL